MYNDPYNDDYEARQRNLVVACSLGLIFIFLGAMLLLLCGCSVKVGHTDGVDIELREPSLVESVAWA